MRQSALHLDLDDPGVIEKLLKFLCSLFPVPCLQIG
jgi:hypothetical protein